MAFMKAVPAVRQRRRPSTDKRLHPATRVAATAVEVTKEATLAAAAAAEFTKAAQWTSNMWRLATTVWRTNR